MNIFDQYGIKEVADVTLYSIHKKQDGSGDVYYVPALYLDTLKISTVEKTAENVWAQGGLGNARLISWDYGKEINVTLEDALCTPASLGLCWNGALSADWKDAQININTDVCYCKNPVTRISRMEKAIFPRDEKKKNTVSELLPKTSDDRIDVNLDILKKSSVVDGVKIDGHGLVRNHAYRWKMAIESEVKSIAQVPDRFFDTKGKSYPIDWNRKVSVTSLPTYENYKDAVIYKINSCNDLQMPKAKIIFDDAMENTLQTDLVDLLSILLHSDGRVSRKNIGIELTDGAVTRKIDGKAVLKNVIILEKGDEEYILSTEDLYNQILDLTKSEQEWLVLAKGVDGHYAPGVGGDIFTIGYLKKMLLFTRKNLNSLILLDKNHETDTGTSIYVQDEEDNLIIDNTYTDYLFQDEYSYENAVAYYGKDVIEQKDIEISIPRSITNGVPAYKSPDQTVTLSGIVSLKGSNNDNNILINNKLISQLQEIHYQILENVSHIATDLDVDITISTNFGKMLAILKSDYYGKFLTYNTKPTGTSFDTKTLYFTSIFNDKYKEYIIAQNALVSSKYLQNRTVTSLFAIEKDNSLIKDELGSVERDIIQFESIDKADYLAIIVDNLNNYHALIGINDKRNPYYNDDYNDDYNSIVWYRPETEIDVTQFKGLDMWLRFQSINEMIYFLITKYEQDIREIATVTIDPNIYDPTYAGGYGEWAVNKQETTVIKNSDSESIEKRGRLWAYVNPRSMAPYPDDYWFHQGEPIYVKSLTIAPKGKKIKGNKITVRADQWPGMYMMVGETYIRSRETGEDERMQIKFPLCKVKSDQTLTLEAEGDPTTFNLNLEVARPQSGVMMELTSYEIAERLLEGDNGCFYAVDGSTQVLSE